MMFLWFPEKPHSDIIHVFADVAWLVKQFIRNEKVASSNSAGDNDQFAIVCIDADNVVIKQFLSPVPWSVLCKKMA